MGGRDRGNLCAWDASASQRIGARGGVCTGRASDAGATVSGDGGDLSMRTCWRVGMSKCGRVGAKRMGGRVSHAGATVGMQTRVRVEHQAPVPGLGVDGRKLCVHQLHNTTMVWRCVEAVRQWNNITKCHQSASGTWRRKAGGSAPSASGALARVGTVGARGIPV
jgi:hypothetical protein